MWVLFFFLLSFPFPGPGAGSESDAWLNSSSSATVALNECLAGGAEDEIWPALKSIIDDGGTAVVILDEVTIYIKKKKIPTGNLHRLECRRYSSSGGEFASLSCSNIFTVGRKNRFHKVVNCELWRRMFYTGTTALSQHVRPKLEPNPQKKSTF